MARGGGHAHARRRCRGRAGAPADPRALVGLERDAIVAALDAVGGNRRKAAEILGIAERTLSDKRRRYDIGQG